MTEHAQPPAQVVNGEEIAWTAHPRFADIQMKQMLTSAAYPLASVSRTRPHRHQPSRTDPAAGSVHDHAAVNRRPSQLCARARHRTGPTSAT